MSVGISDGHSGSTSDPLKVVKDVVITETTLVKDETIYPYLDH
jgi:hypothetical protein